MQVIFDHLRFAGPHNAWYAAWSRHCVLRLRSLTITCKSSRSGRPAGNSSAALPKALLRPRHGLRRKHRWGQSRICSTASVVLAGEPRLWHGRSPRLLRLPWLEATRTPGRKSAGRREDRAARWYGPWRWSPETVIRRTGWGQRSRCGIGGSA